MLMTLRYRSLHRRCGVFFPTRSCHSTRCCSREREWCGAPPRRHPQRNQSRTHRNSAWFFRFSRRVCSYSWLATGLCPALIEDGPAQARLHVDVRSPSTPAHEPYRSVLKHDHGVGLADVGARLVQEVAADTSDPPLLDPGLLLLLTELYAASFCSRAYPGSSSRTRTYRQSRALQAWPHPDPGRRRCSPHAWASPRPPQGSEWRRASVCPQARS